MPVSASAAPHSWADWLAEEPRPPRPPAAARRSSPSAELLGIELRGHTDAPRPQLSAAPKPAPAPLAAAPSYDKYLTAEERAIIDAQKTPKARARTRTAPGFAQAAPPKAGRRRPRTEELIRQLGDHLTPEELAILEQQLD